MKLSVNYLQHRQKESHRLRRQRLHLLRHPRENHLHHRGYQNHLLVQDLFLTGSGEGFLGFQYQRVVVSKAVAAVQRYLKNWMWGAIHYCLENFRWYDDVVLLVGADLVDAD